MCAVRALPALPRARTCPDTTSLPINTRHTNTRYPRAPSPPLTALAPLPRVGSTSNLPPPKKNTTRDTPQEDALVVYTLVDPKAVKAVQTACKLQGVRYVDLWSELLDNMEVHLNAVRRCGVCVGGVGLGVNTSPN